MNSITSASTKNILDDSIYKIVPKEAVFFVFDTETTGLNFFEDDEVTEVAVIAYDKNFNYIDRYHASSKTTEAKQPIKIIQKSIVKIQNILNIEEEAKELVIKIFKRYIKHKKMGNVKEEFFYNELKRILESYKIDANFKSFKQVYYILSDIAGAYELKKILRMTKYGKIKVDVNEPSEMDMAKNFFQFIQNTIKKTETKHPIAVAHNYPYDYMMMRQAASRAGIPYTLRTFIDTAQFSRKVMNKYVMVVFAYYFDKWKKTKDEKIAKILIKLKPIENNRMGTLTQFFSIPNLNWHTAKNDVEATAELLKYLFAMDARFKDFFVKKPDIQTILSDSEKKHDHKDFFKAVNQSYLYDHKNLWSEFQEMHTNVKKQWRKKSNSPYSQAKKFKDKLKIEFGIGGDKKRTVKKGPAFEKYKRETFI